MSDIRGQCLCGQIKYTITTPPISVTCCYCKDCQTKSGSDHSVCLVCDEKCVTISGKVSWYTNLGDSGMPKEHGFCSTCGTNLFGRPQYWSGTLIVYAGSLIDSNTYAPKVNVWTKDAPVWCSLDKSLKNFDKNPS